MKNAEYVEEKKAESRNETGNGFAVLTGLETGMPWHRREFVVKDCDGRRENRNSKLEIRN
jgi:hypothetical protein